MSAKPLFSQCESKPEGPHHAAQKQAENAISKQHTSNQPPEIGTLISRCLLHTAIKHHRYQQQRRRAYSRMPECKSNRCQHDAKQFTRTSRTDWKPPFLPVERAVIPAVAAKHHRQYTIQPGNHRINRTQPRQFPQSSLAHTEPHRVSLKSAHRSRLLYSTSAWCPSIPGTGSGPQSEYRSRARPNPHRRLLWLL